MVAVSKDLLRQVLLVASLDHYEIPLDQIDREIKRYRITFLYLAGRHGAREAYTRIRKAIAAGHNPDLLVPNPPAEMESLVSDLFHLPARVDGKQFDFNKKLKARGLPDWFRLELEVYLSDRTHQSIDKDLAFWVASRLMANGRFMFTVDLLRQRWRILKHDDVTRWYEEMNTAHEKALQFARRCGYYVQDQEPVSLSGPSMRDVYSTSEIVIRPDGTLFMGDIPEVPHPGEIAFLQPFDARDTQTYGTAELKTYGLPILDYERDVRALTWLAGGTPRNPAWHVWTEALLWDFKNQSAVYALDQRSTNHWELRRPIALGRLGLKRNSAGSMYEIFGRMLSLPARTHTLADNVFGNLPGQPGVTFLSRWIEIAQYPANLQAPLVYSIIKTWGLYNPLPGAQNIRRRLDALLKPINRDEVPLLNDDPEDVDAVDRRDRELAAARKRRERQK